MLVAGEAHDRLGLSGRAARNCIQSPQTHHLGRAIVTKIAANRNSH